MFIEVRFHGRGGQGAVTSAELLAKAAVIEGKYAQAFPSFGPERTGAPVKSFCRISDEPITIRSQIYNPDYIIVLDDSLLQLPEVREGIKENTILIVNSDKIPETEEKTFVMDATKFAINILGRNIVSTAMLGIFAKITNIVSIESVLSSLEKKFKGSVLESNKQLVKEIYRSVKI